MKKWILLLMRVGGEADKWCDKLDERIERLALDPFGRTMEQCEKILALSDLKGRLLNLSLMRELLVRELDPQKLFLISRYAEGLSVARVAAETNAKESTAYKRLRAALLSAERILASAGFDESRMDRDYSSVPVVAGMMKRLRKSPKQPA